MSTHKEMIDQIEERIEEATKQGKTSELASLFKLKAELLGLFKDESGGENFILNIDVDHSRICFLNDKISSLEAENLKLKTENEEMRKILGTNLQS